MPTKLSKDNKAIIREFFEALEDRNWDLARRIFGANRDLLAEELPKLKWTIPLPPTHLCSKED